MMAMPQGDTIPEISATRLRVAKILGVHGLRGTIKLQIYTVEAENVVEYGPLYSRDGTRSFRVTLKNPAKGHWLAHLSGITNRSQAEPLIGMDLFVDRSVLPPPDEDEFYEADLLDLPVEDQSGQQIGIVRGLHNFGAGLLLDIRLSAVFGGRDVMIPFTHAAVPVIELARDGSMGRVVIDPPDGLLDPPDQLPDQSPEQPDDMPDGGA